MHFLSNKSCTCSFSSLNSVGAILYGAIDIGSVPGIKSIQNSISLYGRNPGKSLRNTSMNLMTVGTLSVTNPYVRFYQR